MIDHVVFASSDPLATRARLAEATGVELGPGGAHVGRGTRNWLGDLGGGCYLELIGPDPDQPEPEQPRPFGVDGMDGERLVAWCSRQPDLRAFRTRVADTLAITEPEPMQRRSPTGLLSWELAYPLEDAGGVVPFFIDWLDSPHPTTVVTRGLDLVRFSATHPEADRVGALLAAIEENLVVTPGDAPALQAELRGPAGSVALG